MRVFFDSNVLLSAALWPHGATAACYRSAVAHEHVIVVSDYVLGSPNGSFRRALG